MEQPTGFIQGSSHDSFQSPSETPVPPIWAYVPSVQGTLSCWPGPEPAGSCDNVMELGTSGVGTRLVPKAD